MSQGSYSNPPDAEVLSFREAIRRRPGMYLGDASGDRSRIRQIVIAVLAATNRPRPDSASRVDIRREPSGRIVVESDGPRLELDRSFHGRDFVDSIAASPNGIELRQPNSPSWQQHHFHLEVLTHSCRSLTIEEAHEQSTLRVIFVDGVSSEPVRHHSSLLPCRVRLSFEPDPLWMGEAPFDLASLRRELEALAVCHRGLAITLYDAPPDTGFQLYFPQGTRSYVQSKLDDASVKTQARKNVRARASTQPMVFSAEGTDGPIHVEVTLVWGCKERQFVTFTGPNPDVNMRPSAPVIGVEFMHAMTAAAGALGIPLPRRRSTMNQLFRRSVDLGASVIAGAMYEAADGYMQQRPPAMIHDAVHAVLAEPLTAFLVANPKIVRRVASR